MEVPLGPRQEELLSYLQGLAPLGDAFEFRRAQALVDLGFNSDSILYRALRQLIRKGFVQRLGAGQSGPKGRLRVLRHLGTAGSSITRSPIRARRRRPQSPEQG